MNSEHRVEEKSHLDTLGFTNQLETGRIAVKSKGSAFFGDMDALFVFCVEHLFACGAIG